MDGSSGNKANLSPAGAGAELSLAILTEGGNKRKQSKKVSKRVEKYSKDENTTASGKTLLNENCTNNHPPPILLWFSHLCLKMLSFLLMCNCIMPRTFLLSREILFPV